VARYGQAFKERAVADRDHGVAGAVKKIEAILQLGEDEWRGPAAWGCPTACYHPTVTLRMSSSAGARVVEADLRLWACGNCYISNTAVSLSMGRAHPKLIHLTSTSRLAGHNSGVCAR
jgi:hypothetical protein